LFLQDSCSKATQDQHVYIVFAAFDKPQATITESEGGMANGRAREEELTCLGDISYLYLLF